MASSDEKAAELNKWLLHEMHYRPRGRHANTQPPDPEQLKPLLRGQSAHIFHYLLNNVRSAQTVKTIKGNLKLKSMTKIRRDESDGDDEWAELSEKRMSLLQELNSKRIAIGHVEKDLQRLKTDIVVTDERYKESASVNFDNKRKSALLKAYSHEVNNNIELYDEFRTRIQDKTNLFQNRENQSGSVQLYTKQGSESTHEGHNLETACTRSVREGCESIGIFLDQLLQGKFADASDSLAIRKNTLWGIVDQICAAYPPSQLLLSLSVYAQDSAIALRDKTMQVDIRKDAEALRFKYEANGHLKDTSVEPSVIETVSLLLEDAHRANIQRFMETEKCKNSAWKLSEQLEKAKQPVLAHLTRSYRGDPGALQLANTLLDKETQVAVTRANLRQLHHISEELKDRISRATREKEILYSKYQQIQDFKKVVDQKQNLIRVLVKQNFNARSKLEGQQTKIAEYVQRSMSVHEPEMRSHNANLKDHVTTEVETFASLSLPFLMFTTLSDAYKMAVIDLSINQYNNTTKSVCRQTLKEIRHLLECPTFKAPEYLSEQILKLKTEVAEVSDVLARDENTWDAEQAPLLARISGLCTEVNHHDAEQLEELLPTLQKRISHATQALTDCLNVKDAVQYWWEQPAQHVTPWMRVDDLTFQQWKDKWTVLVTRLRQMQIK